MVTRPHTNGYSSGPRTHCRCTRILWPSHDKTGRRSLGQTARVLGHWFCVTPVARRFRGPMGAAFPRYPRSGAVGVSTADSAGHRDVAERERRAKDAVSARSSSAFEAYVSLAGSAAWVAAVAPIFLTQTREKATPSTYFGVRRRNPSGRACATCGRLSVSGIAPLPR
jgi:hypothetical protein